MVNIIAIGRKIEGYFGPRAIARFVTNSTIKPDFTTVYLEIFSKFEYTHYYL